MLDLASQILARSCIHDTWFGTLVKNNEMVQEEICANRPWSGRGLDHSTADFTHVLAKYGKENVVRETNKDYHSLPAFAPLSTLSPSSSVQG